MQAQPEFGVGRHQLLQQALAAVATLAVLCVAGCGNSKPTREQIKMSDMTHSRLFTAVQLPGAVQETISTGGSPRSGPAYVKRLWQLPPGADPTKVFNTAKAKLVHAGVLFLKPLCTPKLPSAAGVVSIPATFERQGSWPASLNLLVAGSPGIHVGPVHSPFLELDLVVSYGQLSTPLPAITTAPPDASC